MRPSFAVPFELVNITGELALRPARPADYQRQKAAITDLARQLGDGATIPRLVELAMELCGADSAGISLYEPVAGEAGVFRWHHLLGVLAQFNGATTPRDHSPCGVCLDRDSPILMSHPERIYEWIADAGIEVPEVLLVPLRMNQDDQLGTLWVVAPKGRQFDSEDARLLRELANFTGLAVQMQRMSAAQAHKVVVHSNSAH